MANQKISLPQTYYTSPLIRACQTAEITFADLCRSSSAEKRPSVVVVKEVDHSPLSILFIIIGTAKEKFR